MKTLYGHVLVGERGGVGAIVIPANTGKARERESKQKASGEAYPTPRLLAGINPRRTAPHQKPIW